MRRSFKVWGLLYTCLSTKSVAIWACPGYSTDAFLTTHRKQTSIYGEPRLVMSDHGSQLVKAAKQLIDWNVVTSQTSRSGTKWVFTPKGCSWRNGQAERAIGMAKKTLLHQLASNQSLDFAQLDSLFAKTAHILNSRPLGVRNFSEDNFHAITPNDLLLGRAASTTFNQENLLTEEELGKEINVDRHLSAVEELTQKWWKEWISVAFPLLAPRRKWQQQHRNLSEGDIVLLKYDKKLGPAKFRLARVLAVHPDVHGVVRTVTIGLRDQRKKERWNRCAGTLTEMPVGIQRLVVVLPVEEQVMTESISVQGGLDMQIAETESPADAKAESVLLKAELPALHHPLPVQDGDALLQRRVKKKETKETLRKSRRLRCLPPVPGQLNLAFEKFRTAPGLRLPSPEPQVRETSDHLSSEAAGTFGVCELKEIV